MSPGDDLAGDDRRYLAIKRPEPRKVLLVAPDAEGRRAARCSRARPLETLTTLALTADVRTTPLGDPPLIDYSFVVVTDVGLLDGAQAAALQDYVEGGGRALLAAGPRSARARRRCRSRAQTLRGEPADGQRGAGLDRRGRCHASGAARSRRAAGRELRPLRHRRAGRRSDRVLMRLADGTPLLLERAIGDGRVLLFTSSLDREWNDLAVQPAFVPLMAGIANELLGGAGFTSEADLGSTLAVRALGFTGGQIFDPRGEAALGLGAGSDDVLLDQVGFYEVVGGGIDRARGRELRSARVGPDARRCADARSLARARGAARTSRRAGGRCGGDRERAELARAVARDVVARARGRGIRGRKLAS